VLETQGDWLTLKDMSNIQGETQHAAAPGRYYWYSTGSHVTLDNVDFTGKWTSVSIDGGDHVTFQNSEIGTAHNTAIRLCGQDDLPMRLANATNLVLNHLTFHPFLADEDAGRCGGGTMHLETIRAWDSIDGMLLENSWFDDGDGSNSARFFSAYGGCPPPACPPNRNMHFVNNYFGDLVAGLAAPDVFWGSSNPCQGFVFAYNFFKNGLIDNCAPADTDQILVGNMGFNSGGCVGPGVETGNLWIAASHGTCAGDHWVTDPTPLDWSGYNLAADGMHLTASSPSINAGESTYCAMWAHNVDFDGQPRTGVCDVGPDEFQP
jgi:hypothetical protein